MFIQNKKLETIKNRNRSTNLALAGLRIRHEYSCFNVYWYIFLNGKSNLIGNRTIFAHLYVNDVDLDVYEHDQQQTKPTSINSAQPTLPYDPPWQSSIVRPEKKNPKHVTTSRQPPILTCQPKIIHIWKRALKNNYRLQISLAQNNYWNTKIPTRYCTLNSPHSSQICSKFVTS